MQGGTGTGGRAAQAGGCQGCFTLLLLKSPLLSPVLHSIHPCTHPVTHWLPITQQGPQKWAEGLETGNSSLGGWWQSPPCHPPWDSPWSHTLRVPWDTFPPLWQWGRGWDAAHRRGNHCHPAHPRVAGPLFPVSMTRGLVPLVPALLVITSDLATRMCRTVPNPRNVAVTQPPPTSAPQGFCPKPGYGQSQH